MKVQQFLAHHGIRENPFGQEDAQSDPVFKQYCLTETHHPAWDKIYGDPASPSTAVVFGEKGSGKTALRLQVIGHLQRYNQEHPDARVYVVEYDDFNPFLDAFRERLGIRGRRADRALEHWRLWDHMDAILSLATTQLVDAVINGEWSNSWSFSVTPDQLARLTRLQKRDLLMLTTFYDRSLAMPYKQRWGAVRRKLRFYTFGSWWHIALGLLVTVGLLAGLIYSDSLAKLGEWWPWAILVAGWAPWLFKQARLAWLSWRISKQVRVIDHQLNALRQLLGRFTTSELAGQPIPSRDRSDDRYELLNKLQSVLRTLDFGGITVLVDRVDEPHLINGSPEKMRDLLWPMFDNKFLKHSGLGFKLLLPIEVSYHLTREDKEFYERSRLDKQNLVRSLEWTGESLYDVANDRIRAVSEPGKDPTLRELFDESITEGELIGTLARLRVPRHLFRFIHRVLVEHCNRYTVENPQWTIARETLQSSLALYMRDLEAFDRGLGTG